MSPIEDEADIKRFLKVRNKWMMNNPGKQFFIKIYEWHDVEPISVKVISDNRGVSKKAINSVVCSGPNKITSEIIEVDSSSLITSNNSIILDGEEAVKVEPQVLEVIMTEEESDVRYMNNKLGQKIGDSLYLKKDELKKRLNRINKLQEVVSVANKKCDVLEKANTLQRETIKELSTKIDKQQPGDRRMVTNCISCPFHKSRIESLELILSTSKCVKCDAYDSMEELLNSTTVVNIQHVKTLNENKKTITSMRTNFDLLSKKNAELVEMTEKLKNTTKSMVDAVSKKTICDLKAEIICLKNDVIVKKKEIKKMKRDARRKLEVNG